MKMQLRWQDQLLFLGQTESGHCVAIDGPPDVGGQNLGMRPMEMLLLGLGGCTGIDIVTILQKGRHTLTQFSLEVSGDRAEQVPKVFTQIHVHYRLAGPTLTPAVVERAIKLSSEKYCSASIMLGATAQLTHSYELG